MGKISLFSSLTAQDSLDLFGRADLEFLNEENYSGLDRVQSWEQKDSIFREGSRAEGLHFLLEGQIKICHTAANGTEVVYHVVRPKQFFGETAAFRRDTYPADAVVFFPSKTLFLPMDILETVMKRNALFSFEMSSLLALRLRMFTRKIESLNSLDVLQRLARYLAHRSHMTSYKNTVTLDMPRETLAAMLGTSRETLSRAFSRLEREGAVVLSKRTVEITGKPPLEDFMY